MKEPCPTENFAVKTSIEKIDNHKVMLKPDRDETPEESSQLN